MRIMDEDMFPDYEPKRTPDTIFDFGLAPDSKIQQIFDELEVKRSGLFPIMELKHLKRKAAKAKYVKTYSLGTNRKKHCHIFNCKSLADLHLRIDNKLYPVCHEHVREPLVAAKQPGFTNQPYRKEN